MFSQETLTKILLLQIKRLNKLEVPIKIMLSRVFAGVCLFLLVLTLSALMFISRAEANFVLPPVNPEIHFLSPVNTTYCSNNVSIKVGFETYKTHYYGGPTADFLRQFQYALDGGEFQRITITNSSIGQNPGSQVWFEGLIRLK